MNSKKKIVTLAGVSLVATAGVVASTNEVKADTTIMLRLQQRHKQLTNKHKLRLIKRKVMLIQPAKPLAQLKHN